VRGAIIAAGGPSRRMGRAKPLMSVAGVPLVVRVAKIAEAVAEDVVVVTKPRWSSHLHKILPHSVEVVDDNNRIQSPLVALISGATALASEYVAFLACDLPLLSSRLLESLFNSALGQDAALPRWPDGRIEPMVAIYRRTAALSAAREALAAGGRANTDMIGGLADVRYVSTEELRATDSNLGSFVNVNTPADARAAEARITRGRAFPRGRAAPRRSRRSPRARSPGGRSRSYSPRPSPRSTRSRP